MVRQRMEYEKMCRQMDDIKEEMRTRVRQTGSSYPWCISLREKWVWVCQIMT